MDITDICEYKLFTNLRLPQPLRQPKQLILSESPMLLRKNSTAVTNAEQLSNCSSEKGAITDFLHSLIYKIIDEAADTNQQVRRSIKSYFNFSLCEHIKSLNIHRVSSCLTQSMRSTRSEDSTLTSCDYIQEPISSDITRIQVYLFNTPEYIEPIISKDNTIEQLIKHANWVYQKSHNIYLHAEDFELRMIDEDSDEYFHPDYESTPYHKSSTIGSTKSKEFVICECKNKTLRNSISHSINLDKIADIAVAAPSIDFRAKISIDRELLVIDLVKEFIKQANHSYLNTLADHLNGSKYIASIQNSLIVKEHNEDNVFGSVMDYKYNATSINLYSQIKHLRTKKVDVTFKMYGDMENSEHGKFCSVNSKKARTPSLATTSNDRPLRSERFSVCDECISSTLMLGLLKYYKILLLSGAGAKKEQVMGIDLYGIYIYNLKWEFYSNAHKLETMGRDAICLSGILLVELCKSCKNKFYLYYLDKKKIKEKRLFIEAVDHIQASEIIQKIRMLTHLR